MQSDAVAGDTLRLVKLRLPAHLVRAMDERIVASRGTYLDRNEFVAEAVWDRINEDAARDGSTAVVMTGSFSHATDIEPVSDVDVGAETSTSKANEPIGLATSDFQPLPLHQIAERRAKVPTLPRQAVGGTIFGLHNRDLPTLWIVTHLARMTAEDGGPIPWNGFVNRLRGVGQEAGLFLRAADSQPGVTVKASVGFPKPGDKARASEDRLVTTALGAPSRSGLTGPGLLLGLVGTDDPTEARPAVAVTTEALDLIADLADAGFGLTLPQPEAATRRWLDYVATYAPEEHGTWLRVLRIVSKEPTRPELVARFPEWTGSTADTNTTGYVSRGREWGLVAPELSEGRYRLTPLGERVVAGGISK